MGDNYWRKVEQPDDPRAPRDRLVSHGHPLLDLGNHAGGLDHTVLTLIRGVLWLIALSVFCPYWAP